METVRVDTVGEVPKTSAPLPVSSVTATATFALDGVASIVATPVAKPDTPVPIGRPVAFVSVAEEGVPRFGVTNVGEVANTSAPEPVSSGTAAATFALDGVASIVATPVPRPETPEIGRPVALVSVSDEGVPRFGVTNVGEVAKTSAPDPVSSVTAAATLALVGVASIVAIPVARPETPELIGRPVALVSTAEAGVPSAGVTSVGEFDSTTLPEPVDDVTPVPPLATLSVPLRVTTPVVPVLGERPVVPAEKLVTAPDNNTLPMLA